MKEVLQQVQGEEHPTGQGRQLYLFINDTEYEMAGDWQWDLQSDAVFCSDVMLALQTPFEGTRGIIHPDDKAYVLQQTGYPDGGTIPFLQFRIITTYGDVKGVTGRNLQANVVNSLTLREPKLLQQLQAAQDTDLRTQHLAAQKRAGELAERLTGTGTWYYNAESNAMHYSDEVFRIYGLPRQSLNAHLSTFMGFIHPDDLETVSNTFTTSLKERVPLHLEYRIVSANGAEKWVHLSSHWEYNEYGSAMLYGTLQDITEQYAQEQQLQLAAYDIHFKDQIIKLHEQVSQMAHWYVNLVTRKVVYSDAMYRIHGLKPGSIAVTGNSFINYVHPEDRDVVMEVHKKILQQHVPPDLEFHIIRNDGKVRQVRQQGKLVAYGEGEMVMLVTLQDITVEKTAAEKLATLKHQFALGTGAQRQADEMALMGTFWWDPETDLYRWSESLFRLLGQKYTDNELTQKSLMRVLHPDDRAVFNEALRLTLVEKQERQFEFRMVRTSEHRQFRALFKLMPYAGRELVVGTLQDITELHNLRGQVLQQAQQATSIAENMLDRIVITDTENTIRVWNKRSEETYGIKKEAAIGRNIFDVLPQLKNEASIAQFNRVLNGETIIQPHVKGLLKQHYHDLHMIPLHDAENRVSGILHLLHDVTREREIQQRLTERLNFIESLLEASVDRILAMDRYMNYLYCNQNAAAYYGLRKEDIVGKNVLEIFPASVNDPTHDHFRRALKGETVHIPAIEGLSEEHYYEVFLIPIFSDAGTVSAVLWIHHDLSSEIKMQRQLRKSHEVLNAIESVFIELDSDYGYRYVNDTAERYLGKRRDELIGKVMWEVFPQTVGTPGYEAVVKASQERVKVEVEYFSPIFNKWVFLSVVPTSDGVILFFYDRQDIKEAQQKLVEEHRRMADAQALGKIGSFEWNVVDGDIVWSDELYRLNGLEPQSERITIERANAFIHPEHYGDLKKLQEQLIAKPGLYQITYRIVLRDGTVKWVNHQLESIAGENGAVVRVYGTVQDITAQRHIAEQLKEQSHYLQRITETVPDMVSVMELPSKKIQYLNKDVFVANGFDPDAMTHQSAEELAALIHPDDLQALSGYYEGLSKASDTDILTAAYRARNNAGAWQWFHVRGKVFQRDGTGQVTQILNAIENITDRKKAEAELFKNLNLLQQAEAVTSIGSWEYCIAEDKIEWSEGMYRLFDLEPGSKVTKEIYLEYVVKDDRPLVREMLKRMKKGVEPVDETITITSKTGMRKVLKVKGIAVKDAAGKPERMLGVDVDITEMVRAEENLVSLNRSLDRRNKELKVKNEELANFSFIASHDLREPLRKIHTFSDWLLERESENLSAAGQDYLKRMSGAVKRMDRLIDDVLALTKMHAATFETGTVDLNDVLKQAKAELAESIKATKARIEADNLPAITGNQVQLRYLFQNLISNAITFQKPGNQPQLTIMSERATAAEVVEAGLDIEQTYAKVCVSDNGIGIDEMYHPKIFQIFQRLHARTEYDGTGIGLTICKRVMENHNGTITIESTLGKGATFCCYFPVA